MRNDLESLNPGKLAAQATHVGHTCAAFFRNQGPIPCVDGTHNFTPLIAASNEAQASFAKLFEMWDAWEKSTTQFFGTTICLGASEDQLLAFKAKQHMAYVNEIILDTIIDPTYPARIPMEIAKYLSGKFVVPENIIVRSNDAILLRPEMTGGFAFGDKDSIVMQELVKDLQLYP